jgi:two-component system OmpR family sensor kinase
MDLKIRYSGLVIAAIGFFLTRFTVTLAVFDSPLRFVFAGLVPLTLGLGLAAFGVALAVSDVDRGLVRTTATWCVIGAGTMLVLVVLTLVGATAGGMPDLVSLRSRTYLANFLIGGAVGGTLTGLYAGRNRRQQRDLRQQTNRLEVLNRLLRHEILNSLTAIRGYAALRGDDADRATEVIDRRTDDIESTIEEVKYLTRTAGQSGGTGASVDLASCLHSAVESVREAHPDATVTLGAVPDDVRVRANERVEQAFVHLLENAVVHSDRENPNVEVSVATTPTSVRVAVADDGPGLPADQRRLLEDGDIGSFDDPKAGFGLNVVRLLVESYRGTIETSVTETGSTVTVVLPRAAGDGAGIQSTPSDLTAVSVSGPRLLVTVGAALLAGAIMGVATELLGGAVPVIGALYGVQSPVVGWFTHEFHSVVFGFVFAGLLTAAPERFRESLPAAVGLGVGWSLLLWAGAAGVVMPIWLNLVGVQAPVPNLALTPLLTHLTWGVSIGLLVPLGFDRVTPLVERHWPGWFRADR